MRRRYVTHPKFQFSFTFSFGLGAIITIVVIAGLFVGGLSMLAHDPLLSVAQKEILINGTDYLLKLSLFSLLFSTLGFVFLGFYLSYKFVGPLSRLESWLEEKCQTPTKETLRLRPGDELSTTVNLITDILAKGKRL